MKSLKITLTILLCNSFSMADNQFNKQHKTNKAYVKTMAISKSKRGDKNSVYIKIKNKKELIEAIRSGKLDSKYSKRGDKHLYIDIRNAHLNKRDLKDLKEVNIRSNIEEKGRVNQVINIKNLKIDTKKYINIGVNVINNRSDSITTTTTIQNSQLGR